MVTNVNVYVWTISNNSKEKVVSANLEVCDNLPAKTKLLLSLEKFMQLKTNPKVQSNLKELSFFIKSPSIPYMQQMCMVKYTELNMQNLPFTTTI